MPTPIKYLSDNGFSTSDLSTLKRTDPVGFEQVKKWAADEMKALGIEVEGQPAQSPTA